LGRVRRRWPFVVAVGANPGSGECH
jgi:hypothetical protein